MNSKTREHIQTGVIAFYVELLIIKYSSSEFESGDIPLKVAPYNNGCNQVYKKVF